MPWRALLLVLALALAALAACREAAAPAPAPLAAEPSSAASGYYCGMLLAEHSGPKGQIHLASRGEPIWFTSVRDTIAFLRLPEEARDITAVYVHDMGAASQWDQPEAGTWIPIETAWFVTHSDQVGGMGAPEAVPFASEAAAQAWLAQHGGSIHRLAEIPDDYILGPVPDPAADSSGNDAPGHGSSHH